ncbi:alpha,alpha-phosphotrehalase [Clostridium sp. YIM B02505]|uniref:Alpha,alpha-phosphotrehalase n=1 Tax=Clostridium yunnanense TaxID=2800325 RepID=A0ABS1ENI4_9CLOT|nr:alpha,alpha-phosphotrehalase [Clostridium yunnanense]MBK1810951.1 alpha,alpha-phosphotrehalase [Clostridium yunnanense]
MKDFKKSVIYQIYPKSFKDSNGDGLGDLRGVIEKLDYLVELGIDYIWLTPFYISPQKDNGYDVADYCSIDKRFGTMKDFEELVEECSKRDIGLMLDMVFNHTSTEHEWFKRALKGEQKYKDYYIFKETEDGSEPTNWKSKFGGSAWKKVNNEYYLHLFDETQADLNWENTHVRDEIYKVVKFWMDKGVTGFRLDVINLISKPYVYEDDFEGDGRRFYTDGPRIHEYLKELNNKTFATKDNILTVGEMSSTDLNNCISYSNPKEKELSMVFNFHHLKVDYKDGNKWTLMDFDFFKLKDIFNNWQLGMERNNGWSAVFWCNHDQPRIVSRFGDEEKYHKQSAKMLATAIHMLRGTPYIYQGEEIGMTNPHFNDIKYYEDIESINYYNILKDSGKREEEILNILKCKSRDNSRTPMQWDCSKNSGFTAAEPWISLSDNYNEINVENSLKENDSIFYHYKKLISLRKEYDVISYGCYIPILENHQSVFAYIREYEGEKLIVINNFYGHETLVNIPSENRIDSKKSCILLSNYEDSQELTESIKLRPYESIVYYLSR